MMTFVDHIGEQETQQKKLIKNSLKEREFEMNPNASFEESSTIVFEDDRSANQDAGNVQLSYNALLERAESREEEESKELRKLGADLRF